VDITTKELIKELRKENASLIEKIKELEEEIRSKDKKIKSLQDDIDYLY
jgi:predicted nuclease with TOPRIM domain